MSAVELAWRVHDVALESIARVDAKAGFAATIQTAALAATGAAASSDRAAAAAGLVWMRWPVLAGAGLLLAAVVLAVFVVLPTTTPPAPASHSARRANPPRPTAPTAGTTTGTTTGSGALANPLYFGSISQLAVDQLEDRLITAHQMAVICEQAITLAQISDRKHRLLRRSLQLALAGGLCAVPFVLGLTIAGGVG